MVAEVFGGIGAIKTAFDIAKGLQNIHDVAARDRAVIELQKEILAAQQAQSTLISRINELEKEAAACEKWGAEKERYALTDFGGNTFAYALKGDAAKGEPPHRICPTCYENRTKSILQFEFRTAIGGRDKYICPACKHEFEFGVRQPPPNRSSGGGGMWGA
jgi:hypothetical protein